MHIHLRILGRMYQLLRERDRVCYVDHRIRDGCVTLAMNAAYAHTLHSPWNTYATCALLRYSRPQRYRTCETYGTCAISRRRRLCSAIETLNTPIAHLGNRPYRECACALRYETTVGVQELEDLSIYWHVTIYRRVVSLVGTVRRESRGNVGFE